MLEMICCDEVRTSKHCPECGKKLEHPLSALHRHLDNVVKIDAAKLETIKKDMKERDANPVFRARRVARVEKTLAKWMAWRDAVGDAIVKAGGKPEFVESAKPVNKKPEPETPAKKSTK